MCGIAGIIHNIQKDYQSNIKLMNEAQIHRGPDDVGIKKYQNAILGHTRLSIVDISLGHQPMCSNSDNLSITFNGEIYGFMDMKKDLNYDFRTNSDTEVIIALYTQYHSNMFQKLKGMFAFAIIDKKERKLHLARDRFGEKPLYYLQTSNGFYFGSEIKTISGLTSSSINFHL